MELSLTNAVLDKMQQAALEKKSGLYAQETNSFLQFLDVFAFYISNKTDI